MYQFKQAGNIGLNGDVPDAFRNREPIEDKLDACLREHPSTGGQVRCLREATESWEAEVEYRQRALGVKLDEPQKVLLDKAHRAWTRYQKAELEFSAAFYSKLRGTMYSSIRASRPHEILKERGKDLAMYSELVAEQTELPEIE